MQFPNQNSWFLCNRPDGPLKASRHLAVSRSFSVAAVQMTELHRPDARSCYFEFDTELDFRRHLLGRFYQTSGRCGNTSGRYLVFQNIPKYFGSPLRMRKAVTALTVRTLGQAVRTRSCFGKNCVILEMRSQKTVRTKLKTIPSNLIKF